MSQSTKSLSCPTRPRDKHLLGTPPPAPGIYWGQHIRRAAQGNVGGNLSVSVRGDFFRWSTHPGAGLIFLSMTQGASSQTRRWLARRVAVNAFVIMNLSLTIGALVRDVLQAAAMGVRRGLLSPQQQG